MSINSTTSPSDPHHNIYFANYLTSESKFIFNFKELILLIISHLIIFVFIFNIYYYFSKGEIPGISSETIPLDNNSQPVESTTASNIKKEPQPPFDKVYEFNGHSYQCFADVVDWQDAKQICEDMGGHLLTITSEEEQAFVDDMLGEERNNPFCIGLFYDGHHWTWITGEQMTYKRDIDDVIDGREYGRNDFYADAEDMPYGIIRYGNWKSSFAHRHPYICEWDYLLADEENRDDGSVKDQEEDERISYIKPEDVFQYEGHSYQYFDDLSLQWDDAKFFCEAFDGHLLTITSEDEQQFIENMMGEYEESEPYIGLHYKNNEWKWVTGEEMSWSKKIEVLDQEDSGYVVLYQNDWRACSDQPRHFICEWDFLGIE